MSKIGIAALAALAVTWTAIAIGVFSGDRAQEERRATEKAEQRARAATIAADSLREVLRADSIADARQDSIDADSIARFREAARLAEASANERTERLRRKLTAEQQAELDDITAYWSTALREAERALEKETERRERAEARAQRARQLALAEREAAERWKSAYDAATLEIEALRKKDVEFLGLKFDVDCNVQGGIGTNQPTKPELQVGCGVPVT